ncbi:chymotrypsin inhibitor 3-like [Vigna radiata var. radiata]|uniref:Chymotrypsin inhibitor 3-like n=1 Tax=Vigna radiata var. radiata TaxID=3916 RepID=A0A1S3TH19_VIGRR|nr:chymotrypsin inhibitor 3-like [Vigna radiata var. radiata]
MASTMLFALFLLSVLTFYPPSITAQPVTDMYGNVVTNGGIFHILPPITIGGGIKRIKTGNETIPLSVARSPIWSDKGQKIRISSPYKSLFIPNGSPVSLEFELIPILGASPTQWVAVAGLTEGTLVKVGYENAITGSFSIHRIGINVYKLLFCTPRATLCGNVALVEDDAGNQLLAVTQKEPYGFVLEEIKSPSAASK